MQETLQPLLLNVAQVSKMLGLGRTKVYDLIATRQIPVVRFGRAVRVPVASLRRWIEEQEQHKQ